MRKSHKNIGSSIMDPPVTEINYDVKKYEPWHISRQRLSHSFNHSRETSDNASINQQSELQSELEDEDYIDFFKLMHAPSFRKILEIPYIFEEPPSRSNHSNAQNSFSTSKQISFEDIPFESQTLGNSMEHNSNEMVDIKGSILGINEEESDGNEKIPGEFMKTLLYSSLSFRELLGKISEDTDPKQVKIQPESGDKQWDYNIGHAFQRQPKNVTNLGQNEFSYYRESSDNSCINQIGQGYSSEKNNMRRGADRHIFENMRALVEESFREDGQGYSSGKHILMRGDDRHIFENMRALVEESFREDGQGYSSEKHIMMRGDNSNILENMRTLVEESFREDGQRYSSRKHIMMRRDDRHIFENKRALVKESFKEDGQGYSSGKHIIIRGDDKDRFENMRSLVEECCREDGQVYSSEKHIMMRGDGMHRFENKRALVEERCREDGQGYSSGKHIMIRGDDKHRFENMRALVEECCREDDLGQNGFSYHRESSDNSCINQPGQGYSSEKHIMIRGDDRHRFETKRSLVEENCREDGIADLGLNGFSYQRESSDNSFINQPDQGYSPGKHIMIRGDDKHRFENIRALVEECCRKDGQGYSSEKHIMRRDDRHGFENKTALVEESCMEDDKRFQNHSMQIGNAKTRGIEKINTGELYGSPCRRRGIKGSQYSTNTTTTTYSMPPSNNHANSGHIVPKSTSENISCQDKRMHICSAPTHRPTQNCVPTMPNHPSNKEPLGIPPPQIYKDPLNHSNCTICIQNLHQQSEGGRTYQHFLPPYSPLNLAPKIHQSTSSDMGQQPSSSQNYHNSASDHSDLDFPWWFNGLKANPMYKKGKKYPPVPKNRALPFVLCHHCFQLLQVPHYCLPPFPLVCGTRIQKIRCGVCMKISKFSLHTFEEENADLLLISNKQKVPRDNFSRNFSLERGFNALNLPQYRSSVFNTTPSLAFFGIGSSSVSEFDSGRHFNEQNCTNSASHARVDDHHHDWKSNMLDNQIYEKHGKSSSNAFDGLIWGQKYQLGFQNFNSEKDLYSLPYDYFDGNDDIQCSTSLHEFNLGHKKANQTASSQLINGLANQQVQQHQSYSTKQCSTVERSLPEAGSPLYEHLAYDSSSEFYLKHLLELRDSSGGCGTYEKTSIEADRTIKMSIVTGFLKRSLKEMAKLSQVIIGPYPRVLVNGRLISEAALRKAEEHSGTIHSGSYWYDYQAGFWGVMGGPCNGIIPAMIEELKYPMSRDCAGGTSGVLANGRELHSKDLEILASRGLPTTPGKAYIIDISGKVVDETTGQLLQSLGKLAPSVEKTGRGHGLFQSLKI